VKELRARGNYIEHGCEIKVSVSAREESRSPPGSGRGRSRVVAGRAAVVRARSLSRAGMLGPVFVRDQADRPPIASTPSWSNPKGAKAPVLRASVWFDRRAAAVANRGFELRLPLPALRPPGGFMVQMLGQLLDIDTPVFAADPDRTPSSADHQDEGRAGSAANTGACRAFPRSCHRPSHHPESHLTDPLGGRRALAAWVLRLRQ